MPKLGNIRQQILEDLKSRTRDLYRELGNLRAVAKAVGKSHTWVYKVVKEGGDNSKLTDKNKK